MEQTSTKQVVLELFSQDILDDHEALQMLKLNCLDDVLAELDRAHMQRPIRHKPLKVKTDVDRALEAAWLDVMTPPQLGAGNPCQLGPHDGAKLFVTHVPGFLKQAQDSLTRWPTDQNLDWWLAAAQEQAFSSAPAPGFYRLLEIKTELMEIARAIHGVRRLLSLSEMDQPRTGRKT